MPPETSHSDAAEAGVEGFRSKGFAVLRGAFAPDYVRQLYDAFVGTYRRYFEDRKFPDATHVGHKRTMISVELKGPFNSPELYANAAALPLIRSFLGDEIVLGGLGGVTSLPGAQDQHVHRDHRGLFDENEAAVPLLPTYAITMIVPLVPLTAQNGTTRMYTGSHIVTKQQAFKQPTFDPYTALGDCIFMDYRTLHGGLANRSGSLRPILYVTYYREWFRDYQNYSKHDPLIISAEEYAKVPEAQRYLLNWVIRGRH